MSVSGQLESLRIDLLGGNTPLGELLERIEDIKEEVEELEYRIESLEK